MALTPDQMLWCICNALVGHVICGGFIAGARLVTHLGVVRLAARPGGKTCAKTDVASLCTVRLTCEVCAPSTGGLCAVRSVCQLWAFGETGILGLARLEFGRLSCSVPCSPSRGGLSRVDLFAKYGT